MILRLPDNLDLCVTNWNNTLHKRLLESGRFQVEFAPLSSPNGTDGYFPRPRVPGIRNQHWSVFEVEGVRVGLDTWDTLAPTAEYEKAGLFASYLSGVELVLKIQHHRCEYWDQFRARTGKRASAWTGMPMHDFPLSPPPFRWQDKRHRYLTSLTGRNDRYGRQPWVDWARTQPDIYTKPDYLSRDPLPEFVKVLRECRWGVVLKGRPGAEKNRREVEYSGCGMPLALNYQPEYPFPMIAGVHYVYLEKPEDLDTLRMIDPRPFAAAAEHLYREYFSPAGIANTLVKLVRNDPIG